MSLLRQEKPANRLRNRPLKDYAGCVFGRLTAIRLVDRDLSANDHLWLFSCSCGTETPLRIKSVRSGHTASCGCLASDTLAARNKTHGLSRRYRQTYRSWKDMRARCSNPARKDFKDYGGRGITICERWSDFAAFVADMGPRPEGLTIDRIDVNGHYEPENCRWATDKTQANNKRSNRLVLVDGEVRTLQSWCDHFGVDRTKAAWRLSRGWSTERVFSKDDHRLDGASDPNGSGIRASTRQF